MKNSENALSILFYLLSIVITIVGVILGIFFMMNEKESGFIIIIFSIINGILVFGLSKVLLMVEELKKEVAAITPEFEKNQKMEPEDEEQQKNNDTTSNEEEIPYNEPTEWTLSSKQRNNILEYYLKDNQKVKETDILVSPFKNYCVVKTRSFIDVIELVDDYPITLNRDQVESFEELRDWIEKNIFRKKTNKS